MHLNAVRRSGRFHARQTRDGEANRRDGAVFVSLNELPNVDGSTSIEVMFEDGFWMLVDPADLEHF